jgi:lipoate-protein ligase A
MQRLNLTLPMAAENVALDEALLEWAEENAAEGEFLRIWETPDPLVVVGRSSRVAQEVDVAECERRGVPIVRRSSGGAAIVAGPGCLMYAVVLSYSLRPELRDITRAHGFVLDRLVNGLRPLVGGKDLIATAGTSDLAIARNVEDVVGNTREGLPSTSWRKFSGNSLRVKRTHFLYHGTLLYDFDLALIRSLLRRPPRQPEYRDARPHSEFVTNLPAKREQLVEALDAAWPTAGEVTDVPRARVSELVEARFGQASWNLEFA